jgi:hypothetical protein
MQKRHNSQWAGIYLFQEKSRNVHIIAGLLIKCSSFAESKAIIESELADCRNQKWLDFVSPEQIATKTGMYFAAGDTSVRFTPTSIEV